LAISWDADCKWPGAPRFVIFETWDSTAFSLVGFFGVLASRVWCEGWLFGRPTCFEKNLLCMSISPRHVKRPTEADMKRQKSYGETVRSVAGFALIGPGLFLLFGHVVGAAGRLSQALDQTAPSGLEVVSSIMLAASWSPNHLAYDLCRPLHRLRVTCENHISELKRWHFDPKE
jgi:hypothetical protein